MARHYESKKGRVRDESGDHMAGPRYGMYKHGREMGGMIHEDERAIANMPQEVMIKAYPARPGYLPDGLDDTITGIDRQLMVDDHYMHNGFMPKKI